ncbi:MAG: alpha-galactosidase [Chitinophagaceae bacterium]|nr:MAG: alpha-galactosidase [Chitinophagaceae bacterium]
MKKITFRISSVFGFLLVGITSIAQKVITIPIQTKDHATVLQTDKDNRLGIVYFGKKISDAAEYTSVANEYFIGDNNSAVPNMAYTPAGTWNLLEPAIQVTHGDGNNSLELKYVSHDVQKSGDDITVTSIVLRDPVYPFEVILNYKTYNKENVVEQWTVIKNDEKKPVVLKKYASANLFFPNSKYYLNHYHGTWAAEMKPEETELTAGIKTLDSKLGTRTNLFQPTVFSLSFDAPATEDNGEVLLGTLAWSGNFKIDFEKDSYNHLRLIAGINPFAAEYSLMPGKSFQTPSFIYTYSGEGKGIASRNLHTWARKYRLADGEGSRLTLLNNWEATYFDYDENKLVELFSGAKDIGVDMFLLDDGWFANKYPRNHDSAGLGDWHENVKKLPHGIGYLVKEAKANDIKFGIWIEPEMVNPKSELYEQHKDWVLRQPQRPEYYFRNQLVLDLSNPTVQDFVYNVVDSLFIKNPELAFIKWDCNAVIYNAHSAYLDKKKIPQSHLYTDYIKGLYSVLERIRKKYPKVPMMLCSGGGGRVDYEALKYFTEYWPSDNTDPIERIFIQWENSYFFPAIASCNHVTDWAKVPLKFRTDVAMMGKLGFDIVVKQLSENDKQFTKQSLATYKSISPLVWHGDLYRLVDPWKNDLASLMFVDKEKKRSVVFNYYVGHRYLSGAIPSPVKFKGLDPAKKYSVKEINLYPGTTSPLKLNDKYSGEYLMTIGINPALNARRTSVILEVSE